MAYAHRSIHAQVALVPIVKGAEKDPEGTATVMSLVDKVVDDAADKLDPPPKSGELLMAELSPYVADHEFVHEFVEGKGTSRYGNKL